MESKTKKTLTWILGLAAGVLGVGGLAYAASKPSASSSGGGSTPSTGKTITLTSANSGQTVNMAVGDQLSITVPIDPSGTQTWQNMPGSNLDSSGNPFLQGVSENMITASGGTYEQVIAKAVKTGTTMLGINLVNTSNPGVAVASFQVNVVVS